MKPGKHFIISSGNHVKSCLTLALDYVPIKSMQLKVNIMKDEEPLEISKIIRIFVI